MKKDETYLKHITEAISDIEKFTEDLSEKEFMANKEKQYAVLRALEILGEATKNLSAELKANTARLTGKACLGCGTNSCMLISW